MNLRGHPALGRAAAVTIVALLAAILWLGPVSGYVALVDSGAERLEEHAALLQRYRELSQQSTSGARTDLGGSSVMLAETAEAQALAQLQEKVKSAAAASRVQVQSLQVLRSEAAGGAMRIGVRVRAAGDIGSLGRLLYAIEAARPVLFPDNLQIQARATGVGGTAETLDFQLDISAFKPGASS